MILSQGRGDIGETLNLFRTLHERNAGFEMRWGGIAHARTVPAGVSEQMTSYTCRRQSSRVPVGPDEASSPPHPTLSPNKLGGEG